MYKYFYEDDIKWIAFLAIRSTIKNNWKILKWIKFDKISKKWIGSLKCFIKNRKWKKYTK